MTKLGVVTNSSWFNLCVLVQLVLIQFVPFQTEEQFTTAQKSESKLGSTTLVLISRTAVSHLSLNSGILPFLWKNWGTESPSLPWAWVLMRSARQSTISRSELRSTWAKMETILSACLRSTRALGLCIENHAFVDNYSHILLVHYFTYPSPPCICVIVYKSLPVHVHNFVQASY